VKIVLAAFVFLACAGCACEPVQTASLVARPMAAPCAAPVAAAPCAPAFAAPQFTYAAAQPVAVQFRVGAAEHFRAGLSVPPQVAACLVTAGSEILMSAVRGAHCALNALVPQPVPSQTFLYQTPPAFAAPQAAPCR
jgi:hypothetical protein